MKRMDFPEELGPKATKNSLSLGAQTISISRDQGNLFYIYNSLCCILVSWSSTKQKNTDPREANVTPKESHTEARSQSATGLKRHKPELNERVVSFGSTLCPCVQQPVKQMPAFVKGA